MNRNQEFLDALASLAEAFEDAGRLDLASSVDRAAFLLGNNKQIVASQPFQEVVAGYVSELEDQAARLDPEHAKPFAVGMIRDVESNMNSIISDLERIRNGKHTISKAAKMQALALLVANLADE